MLLFKTNPYDITEPDLTSQYEGMQATVVAASMGVPSGQEVPSWLSQPSQTGPSFWSWPNQTEGKDGSDREGQNYLVVGATRTGGRKAWAGLQSAARPSSPINVSVCSHTRAFHKQSLTSPFWFQTAGSVAQDGRALEPTMVFLRRWQEPGWVFVRLLVATNSCPRPPPEGQNVASWNYRGSI